MNDIANATALTVTERLATLPSEVQELFTNPENGTPDSISKAGCLALAKLGKDNWNAWREAFPVTGEYPRLKSVADFSNVDFRENPVDFSGFVFGYFADFSHARWGDGADFQGAQWGSRAQFRGAQWGDGANFQGASWEACRYYYWDNKHFQAAKKWAEDSGLSPDSFQRVNFAGAHFAGEADFSNRKFTGHTNFGKLPADFQRIRVQRDENGRARFDEKGELLWEVDPEPRRHVQFDQAPKFHGCELHQDTTFDGAVFPPASGSDDAARAYRTLKLAFSNQQALREEQRFFKLEMEEEALREHGLKSKLFWAYKHFSDYGFSVRLPLCWALGVSGLLMLIYGALSLIGNCWLANACEFAPQWLTFSLLHTLPVPGVDKMAEAAEKVFLPTGGWWELAVSVLVILHKIVLIAALFLAGLALRNLFRLK